MKTLTSLRSLGKRYFALWVGQTISQFGTYVAFLTLPFLVKYLQEQAGNFETLDLAVTYALETAPTLLVGILGGVLLDRWHLRPIMIATDLLRACAFFYLAASVGNYGLNTVFVIAFLIGSMTTLFDGAMFSMIPSLVPEDRLADGNGFVAASQQINFAVGPLVAGVLVATTGGPELGLFINGASFAASAISLKWVGRVPLHRPSTDERAPFFTEAANGLRYIWREPRLRITTIASAIPNFVMGFVEATLLLLAQWVLGAQNMTEVGILVAAMGVGGVIGALVAPRVAERVGVGRTMIAGMGITGIGLLALVFTSYGVIAIALQIGWMSGVSLINVPLATIRQHYSAPSMMGRVISASRALGWATLPIGALVGGWLGADAETYPNIARTFPILLIGTAIWLMSTIVWRDTYGPKPAASVAETTAGAGA